MTPDTTTLSAAQPAALSADPEHLALRRWVVLALNLATMAALGFAMAHVIGGQAWSGPSLLVMTLFLLGLPWTLLGFWNSVIGFVILRLAKDPAGYTNPALRATPADSPVTARTAICLAVRHEDVASAFGRLATMVEEIEASPYAHAFGFHVLSDTSRPDIARAEEAAFRALKARFPQPGLLNYRRRTDNAGFKAGNLREFALSARGRYEHMIVLDADSVMSGAAMLRLVRAMQANPRLGILQTLVVGRPSTSAFTRIFQYGMRHAMRSQTVGSAWWQGSSGPYWGHNAIIRIAPFIDCCDLPVLPGKGPLSGHVLSHDQVEAALMRGAGWEVRVIPDEFESWEENPPSLPDFIKRDLRWAQGNLQYIKLLGLPGLRPMGRFQLINAIAMYAGAPLSLLMLASALLMVTRPDAPTVFSKAGFALYLVTLAMGFAPRFLGMVDSLLQPGGAQRYGGAGRLILGSLVDAVFSLFVGPVMMIAQARFIWGLLFGRRIIWEAQNRSDASIGWGEAARGLWPQFVFGAIATGLLVAVHPGILPWAAPTVLPCLLAVPFTRVTGSRRLGLRLAHLRLCAIPDEIAPAPTLVRADERKAA